MIDHIIDKGVAVLQYADDTIICPKHNIQGARNMKLLLYMYEMMAGLKVNFHKSEVLTINDEDNWASKYAEIFNCQIGTFPIKYLGVPVSPSRLHVIDWIPLVEKNSKKLDIWKGGLMSIAGRTMLINASLSNTVVYLCLYIFFPRLLLIKLIRLEEPFLARRWN